VQAVGGEPAFRDDTGAADVSVSAALAAFAAGSGSEHAALRALAGSRLLMPVVTAPAASTSTSTSHRSELATPVLTGKDGRPALPAFTGLDALQRWQGDARPVPVPARAVWQAAIASSCAVVIDVAGPVALAVEGARLAALAGGGPVPAPFQDPDVRAAVDAALTAEPAVTGFRLAEGRADTDLTVALHVTRRGLRTGGGQLGARAASAIMAALGVRLRRGITVTIARS
jgi:SseB protein N-terminal domain